MNLKKKFADVKSKIRENSATIVAVSSTVGMAVSTGVAIYYKNKLEEEAKNHQNCHDFAHWVVRRAKGKNMRIWADEDGTVTIKSEDQTED